MSAQAWDELDKPDDEDDAGYAAGMDSLFAGEYPGQWRDRGRCATIVNLDQTDFYLEGRFRKGSNEYKAAKALAVAHCKLCPVKQDCLDFALRTDQRSGIWGGLTYPERRKVKYKLKGVAS